MGTYLGISQERLCLIYKTDYRKFKFSSHYEGLSLILAAFDKSGTKPTPAVVKIFANVCICFGSDWQKHHRMDRDDVTYQYVILYVITGINNNYVKIALMVSFAITDRL